MNDKGEGPARQSRQGIFDDKKDEQAPGKKSIQEGGATEPKKDMKDVFAQQTDEIKNRTSKAKGADADNYTEHAVNQVNKALSDADQNLEDIVIDENDIKLAERMIFDGYAETEVSMDNFPDTKFTICSTNAEELGVLDEIIFDLMKEKETEDGMVDIPQNKVQTFRNAMFIALGYRGRDEEDLCGPDRSRHLILIKKAIKRQGDLTMAGNVEKAEALNKSIKEAVTVRARRIMQLPTPLIDFLSAEKYKFDKKMFKIMTTKGVVPKS